MKTTIFDGSFKTTAFIRRLIQGLVNNGVEVSVIGFNEENPQPIAGVNYQSLGSNQSKLRFIKTSLGLALQSGSLSKVLSACQLILKGDRSALQAQNLDLVLKQIKPDVVHVQWPTLMVWLDGYFQNPDFKIVLSQRGFHHNIRPYVKPSFKEYLQNYYPKLDGLHSVSKMMSKSCKVFGEPKTGIDHVVYTGLNFDNLKFNPKMNTNSTLKLISVGRAHWIKDYPTAIQACKILKEHGIDFHYTIVGAFGDEETLFLVHELGLSKEITLTGKLPQQQVFEEVQNSDVMLLPSIEEGIANVAVEAMALGTPVISTNCGGMEELITHNKEGWIVPTRDPQALGDAINFFISLDKIRIKEVTTAARLKVEQQHNEDKMIKDMFNLYLKTIEI